MWLDVALVTGALTRPREMPYPTPAIARLV
jgi:hypothetical protein